MKNQTAPTWDMEYTLAMQIVGAIMILIGIMKNKDPVEFNKGIFGDAEGADGGPAASMRMLIGGAFAAIGSMNLYCSFNVDDAAAGEAILMGNVIGLAVILATLIGAKLRGFLEEIPVPPLVIFPVLMVVCLYSVMG